MITSEKLTQWEAVTNAATEGPWEADVDYANELIRINSDGLTLAHVYMEDHECLIQRINGM